MTQQVHIFVRYRIRILKMRTTVVEHLSVGRPEGEHLELIGIVLDIRHLVLHHIIGNQITGIIINLDLIGVVDMEILARQIGGIHNKRQLRMPSRIYTGRKDRVVTHIDLTDFSIVGNNRTAIVLTGMELHPVGIILLIVMTVDALSF